MMKITNTHIREPLPVVVETSRSIKHGTALDLGSGDGRNSLYLAKNDFLVTAVDKSIVFTDRLNKVAQERGLEGKISVQQKDLEGYANTEFYDLVLSNFVLHILGAEYFYQMITVIKTCTKIGGIAIISDYTQTGPMFSEDKSGRWLKDGELREIFSDWEILSYKEYIQVARMKDEQGNPFKQMMAEIVARKLE